MVDLHDLLIVRWRNQEARRQEKDRKQRWMVFGAFVWLIPVFYWVLTNI